MATTKLWDAKVITVADLIKRLQEQPQDMWVTVEHSINIGLEKCEAAYSNKPYLNLKRED